MSSEPTNPFARKRTVRDGFESFLTVLCWIAAIISVLTTVGIVFSLTNETISFFGHVPIQEFLTAKDWTPLFADGQYGIRALITGTFMIAFGAAIVALPIGLAIAIYLAEYASPRLRKTIKPALELLAGIPSVVFGYFGLTFVTPLLKQMNPAITTYNAISGSIVVGIMILPLVASLSEDAISSVPRATREAAYGLGASKAEVTMTVVLRSAISGIVASFILAISRAVGETMAVTLAAGQTPTSAIDYTKAIGTMTAFFVQVSQGDVPRSGPQYESIFAVGMTLFLITLAMNIISQRFVKRLRRFEA